MVGLSRKDQQRAFCAGMLDGGAHHRFEQPFKDHLTRDGLRYLDHGRQVELFERRRDRARRNSGSFFHLQVRIHLIELPDFPIGAPTEIAVTGISQVRMGDGVKATTRVEARRQLVGQRLVLNKLVLACRLDGRFVQALGIQLSALDAGDFSVHQLRAALDPRKTAARICL